MALSSTSSIFLAMPLEVRRRVYQFCIPENLCFDLIYNVYGQNRPKGWVEPLSRLDRAYGPVEDSESVHFDLGVYEPSLPNSEDSGEEDEEDEEGEYEPTRLDDYCQRPRLYSPEISLPLRSALPGILLVCRQITDEVKAMLYGRNTFLVNIYTNGQSNLEKVFTSETRGKMRKMILVLRPMGASYRPDYCMDPKIWDGILSNLSIIGVIAQQPPRSVPPWRQVTLEDVLEEWKTWLTPISEYLARALPRTTQIVVDANKEEYTVQIMKKAMPGHCRFQRLRAGDFIFQRMKFFQKREDWYNDGPTNCRDIINDSDYDYYYSD